MFSKKSGKLSKVVKGVAFVFVLLIILGAIGSKSDSNKKNNNESALSSSSESSVVVPQESSAEDAIKPAASTDVNQSNSAASSSSEASNHNDADGDDSTQISNDALLDIWMALAEPILKENFDENYRIEKTEDGYAQICVWQDGVAMATMLASAGDETSLESWELVKSGMIAMSESMLDSLNALGMDDPIVILHVLNDQNLDNTLLSMINGVIVSDAVSQ